MAKSKAAKKRMRTSNRLVVFFVVAIQPENIGGSKSDLEIAVTKHQVVQNDSSAEAGKASKCFREVACPAAIFAV